MSTGPQIVPARPETGEILTAGVRTALARVQTQIYAIEDPTQVWTQMLNDSQGAFLYYRDLEEKDDHVGGQLEIRKTGVLSLDRKIVPASQDAEDTTRAEFAQEILDAIPNFHRVLEELLDAPAYGVTIAEILWDIEGSVVRPREIKACPQEIFSFGRIGEPQIGPLRLLANPYALDGHPVPEHKFLVMSYEPRNGNRRGRPLLRRVFWPSWFKRQATRFWLRFGEKGSGTVAVKYPSGAKQDEINKALQAAEALVESIAVAVPENLKVFEELLQAVRSQNPAVFEKLCDRMDLAISRRILGQTLTSFGAEAGAGSRALGEVHETVRFDIREKDARALESVINDQLLKWTWIFNFGADAARPAWVIDKEPPADLALESQIDLRLQQMGMPVPQRWAQKKYGIPEPEEDEAVLEPRVAASPFGPAFAEVPGEDDLKKLRTASLQKALDDYAAMVKRIVAETRGKFGRQS
jgi:phage gp29-like protein